MEAYESGRFGDRAAGATENEIDPRFDGTQYGAAEAAGERQARSISAELGKTGEVGMKEARSVDRASADYLNSDCFNCSLTTLECSASVERTAERS